MKGNGKTDNWVQLPLYYLKHLDFGKNNFIMNIDESVEFPGISTLPTFYRELIMFYNKAFATDKPAFMYNIRNEFLWGNKFITENVAKKKRALFLRNWVRSGIMTISDLHFTNGKLNEEHIYNNVIFKHNIYAEITIVKNALLPYKDILTNAPIQDNTHRQFNSSKQFYSKFVEMKLDNVDKRSNFLTCINNQANQEECFTNKVCNEIEMKLKEFNFKLLHGILPCNNNLKNWKIKENGMCDVCNDIQTIPHLLFECHYVKPIWECVNNICNITMSFPIIVGLASCNYDYVVSDVSFLIYKEWLLSSLENKRRNTPANVQNFKVEMMLRAKIYRSCKIIREEHIAMLENVF